MGCINQLQSAFLSLPETIQLGGMHPAHTPPAVPATHCTPPGAGNPI
jgi:hypothetical protein